MKRAILIAPAIALLTLLAGVNGNLAHAASSTPAITVTPSSNLMDSDMFTITGSNFSPNGWVAIDYRLPDNSIASQFVQADSTGAFKIDRLAEIINGTGTETVFAFDYTTHFTTPTVSITLNPPPIFPPTIAAMGASTASLLWVSAFNLTPNTFVRVDIAWADGTTDTSVVEVDQNGTFAEYLPITSGHGCGPATVTVFTGGPAPTKVTSNTVDLTNCSAA